MTQENKPDYCPNCYRKVEETSAPQDACMLEAAISVVIDRDNVDEDKVRSWWLSADSDRVWSDILGPACDAIEDMISEMDDDEEEEADDED